MAYSTRIPKGYRPPQPAIEYKLTLPLVEPDQTPLETLTAAQGELPQAQPINPNATFQGVQPAPPQKPREVLRPALGALKQPARVAPPTGRPPTLTILPEGTPTEIPGLLSKVTGQSPLQPLQPIQLTRPLPTVQEAARFASPTEGTDVQKKT